MLVWHGHSPSFLRPHHTCCLGSKFEFVWHGHAPTIVRPHYPYYPMVSYTLDQCCLTACIHLAFNIIRKSYITGKLLTSTFQCNKQNTIRSFVDEAVIVLVIHTHNDSFCTLSPICTKFSLVFLFLLPYKQAHKFFKLKVLFHKYLSSIVVNS